MYSLSEKRGFFNCLVKHFSGGRGYECDAEASIDIPIIVVQREIMHLEQRNDVSREWNRMLCHERINELETKSKAIVHLQLKLQSIDGSIATIICNNVFNIDCLNLKRDIHIINKGCEREVSIKDGQHDCTLGYTWSSMNKERQVERCLA